MSSIVSYRLNGLNTVNGFGLNFTGVNYNVLLAANVEQNIEIGKFLPEDPGLTYNTPSYFAIFGVGKSFYDVYAALNDTAVLPTGTIALSTSQPLSDGSGRFIFAGDTISLIASGPINVSISLYFKA